MAQVIELLFTIIARITTISDLLNSIKSQFQHTAVEHISYQIESTVVATSLNVGNPTYGLAALHAQLSALQSDVTAILATAGHVVTLPDPPPGGYGGSTAADVWNYMLLNSGANDATADQALSWAGAFARNFGHLAVPRLGTNPVFGVQNIWHEPDTVLGNWDVPTPDWTDIRPTDTVYTWLTRTTLGYVWSYDASSDLCYTSMGSGVPESNHQIWCFLHDAELQMIAQGYPPGALGGNTPPVWPGLAKVTLGTPVAIAPGVTITEPMDGVLIDMTTIPTQAGYYNFDGHASYLHMGQVAFFSDNGDIEFAQPYGFATHILTVKTMKRAAGCYLRAKVGIEGTVTPWVVT